MKSNLVTVFMTNEEAEMFKLFMQYYDTFELLVAKDVFNQRSASISLNFDPNGILQTIQRNDFLFHRKFDLR